MNGQPQNGAKQLDLFKNLVILIVRFKSQFNRNTG